LDMQLVGGEARTISLAPLMMCGFIRLLFYPPRSNSFTPKA